MGRADVYLQPQAADPVLSDAVVVGLARRHAPHAEAVTGVDESGGEARAYLVDDAIVLKTQRPHRLRPRTSLAKEAYLLDLLAPALGGRIPRLLGYDEVDTEDGLVEYVCMTRVPGRATRNVTLSADARWELLQQLGGVLRTLHTAKVDPDRLPTDTDAAALRRRLEFAFGDLADAFAEHHTTTPPLPLTLEEVIGRALAALPDTLAPTPLVLHSNPSPTHVFVDAETGRFTGVIDFGDSYSSHPTLDLHRWPDPADRLVLREAYLDGTPADAEFDRMWTIAMIYTDLAVIAGGSPHADAAATDLTSRLADL
jgi:aminoglycoside phosphotransferase (APT) family kinase protein